MSSYARRRVSYLIAISAVLPAACLLACVGSLAFTATSGLLIAVFALHVSELTRSIRLYISPTDNERKRPSPRSRISSEVYWSATSLPLLLLLVCTHGTLWSFSGVGFTMQLSPTLCVAVGLAVSVVFNFCTSLPRFGSTGLRQPSDVKRTIATLRSHLPSGKVAQLMCGFRCVYSSPLFEELVYRGFFVFYFSQLASSVYLPVIVGWLLCVVLHLYQGTSRILPVSIFYGVSTSLLFSPVGLLGAIGFHSGCNLEYVLRLRSMAEQYLLKPQQAAHRDADLTLSYGRKLQVAVALLIVATVLEYLPFQSSQIRVTSSL